MDDWSLLAPDEDARDLAVAARAQFAALRGAAAARGALDGTPPPDTWPALVAGGFLDIGLPEELGGLGRLIDLAVVLEEAGRALLTAPLLPSALAFQAQLAAGIHRPGDRARPAAFGLASASATGSGPGKVGGKVGGNGKVGGSGDWGQLDRVHVLGAPGAAPFTLVVAGASGDGVVVIDPTAPGVELLDGATIIDPSRPAPAYRVVDPPPPVLVRQPNAGWRVGVAADLVGIAAGALDAAITHVQSRVQFGQPLGAFQAVKHQLADAYVLVERARGLTYGAAISGDEVDARLAQAVAAEAAVQVAARHVQLLGAMGVTFESDAHLYLRRAHQSVALFGAPDDLFRQAAVRAREVNT